MKFVWVPSIHRYRRTEGEVKKAKQHYEVVEVETDKDSLIDRFNSYEERIEALQQQIALGGHTAASQESTDESAPEPKVGVAPLPPLPAPVPPSQITAAAVEDFILDHATPAQIENIFSALGCRFHELQKQVRVDGQPKGDAPSPHGAVDGPEPQKEATA
jgi:hypothetical protein